MGPRAMARRFPEAKGMRPSPIPDRIASALVVCGGPSLRGFDWSCLDRATSPVIAVNSALYALPRADWWLTVDKDVGRALMPVEGPCQYVASFGSYAAACQLPGFPPGRSWYAPPSDIGIHRLAARGFSWDWTLPGHDSGFSAINLAAMMGAIRIAVLGFDCGGREWWCDPTPGQFKTSRVDRTAGAEQAARQCRERGIEVVNGSPDSLCHAWPRCPPSEAVAWLGGRA